MGGPSINYEGENSEPQAVSISSAILAGCEVLHVAAGLGGNGGAAGSGAQIKINTATYLTSVFVNSVEGVFGHAGNAGNCGPENKKDEPGHAGAGGASFHLISRL